MLTGALLLVLVAACRGGGAEPIKLDGSPRYPDDEGIATSVSRESVVLDGERTYGVSKDLRSFSTFDLSTQSLVSRQGLYVHVGLDGKTVTWIAGIAAVIPDPPRVFYVGVLKARDGERAIFRDGTVLRVDDGVALPPTGTTVQAEIDPRRHRVTKATAA